MPYDGLYMRRVVDEINSKIKGPLRNVYQPTKVDYYLYFQDGVVRLSLNPTFSFMSVSEKMKSPSKMPPSFTMLLRKYLKNARFLGVSQSSYARVANFKFEKIDEKGDLREYTLVVELMGKHSNIVLVSDENVVIDAHRRIVTRKGRELIPGRKFVNFEGGKLDPIRSSFDEVFSDLKDIPVEKFLTKRLEGLSSVLAREIVHRAGFTFSFNATELNERRREALRRALEDFRAEYLEGRSYLILDDDPVDISPVVLHHLGVIHKELSPSEAVNRLVGFREKRDVLKNRKRDLEKVVVKAIEKLEKVVDKISSEIRRIENFEDLRMKGELLMANAYDVDTSSGRIVLKDWSTGEEIQVDVDPRFDAVQNASMYFERYKKLKKKYEGMIRRLSEVKRELEYMYQLWQTIIDADDEETLDEIRSEMVEEGMVKVQKKRKEKTPRSSPRKIRCGDFEVLIGKNNRQNDDLVRSASPSDVWLHARGIPGAHVVIRSGGREVPRDVLECAASLAAGYSKGKDSGNVPVDYTLVKYVRKPKGFKPGMVIYRNQKTIVVNPRRLE